MARRLETVLKEIDDLKADPASASAKAHLLTILRNESCHAVARAAALIEAQGLVVMAPGLRDAFERFMVDPVKTDKGCTAKEAIVKALVNTATGFADLYRKGITFRQLEPAWGGGV